MLEGEVLWVEHHEHKRDGGRILTLLLWMEDPRGYHRVSIAREERVRELIDSWRTARRRDRCSEVALRARARAARDGDDALFAWAPGHAKRRQTTIDTNER